MEMDPHFAQFLYNNEPPSESVIREVEDLLPIPLLELSEIDAEISTFERQLESLKEKRHRVQKSVNDYRRILSPIRRLPDDILYEIFNQTLPQNRNSIMISSEAPLLLTRVSSKWRSIALSSPQLWAQLHITFCDDHSIPLSPAGWGEAHNAQLQQRATDILKLRCRAVREWLSRSGTCPLYISIFYSSNAWNMEQIEMQGEGPTFELFRILLQYVDRWKTIELRMPLEFYRKFEAMFPKSLDALSSLTAVRVNFHPQTSSPLATLDPVTTPIALFQVPNLRQLSLGGFTARSFWNLNSVPFADQGQRLSYICCHGLLTIPEAFQLFKQCRNLKHCKFHIAQDYAHLNPQSSLDDLTDFPPPAGRLFLPYLTSFSILEDGTDPALTTTFYSSIDAPRLRWLEYQRLPYISMQEMLAGDSSSGSPILSLLQRSTELEALLVEPRGFFPSDMRKALETVSPTLTRLVVGQEPSKLTRYMPGRRRNYLPGVPVKQFELDWLIIDSDAEVDLHTPLLPHLESFEWFPGLVSDDVLMRFIKGRMKPSLNIKAALTHVRVVFDRVQQRDVVRDIAQQSDLSGKIKIDLDYLSKPPKKENEPFSASYGLTRDGRTWIHDDI